ncbi:MAG: MalY/PatB family protein [Planktomarina sp.]
MNFDTPIDRKGTHSMKWDMMEPLYGVPQDGGISMWVADMDFRPPQAVLDKMTSLNDHGIYGYFGDDSAYTNAICWWMKTRHNWDLSAKSIFTTHGLVNGTAMCIDTFTDAGDGVAVFTPVYHAFARTIAAAGRKVVELPLVNNEGRYEMDFDHYDQILPKGTRMVILCSPHNPGGRIWTKAELQQVADFARRHDLILVSDEIHHDLTFGATHIPMANIDGVQDRLVMMTAATKTFNIAGCHTGNVIIEDESLRKKIAARMMAMGMSANSFGYHMVTAAYSPEGAAWLDALVAYLDENRRLLDEGLNAIPGVKSMALESTYLAWVDFNDTGMKAAEVTRRVQSDARIATNFGPTFGTGGEGFLRFNFATQRAQVIEAVERMQKAFADLQ